MIELPEAITIAHQVRQTICGKTITNVYGATYLHKFTFFCGTIEEYKALLIGRNVKSAVGKGIFIDICFDNNVFLSISDGINMRYGSTEKERPYKYQMLITFDDHSSISFTTSMYGGIYVFRHSLENKYRILSMNNISPTSEAFSKNIFEELILSETKNISVKALLATGQRIPGIGNGVLQDILFNAGLHPKHNIFSLNNEDKDKLFHSLKNTLSEMTKFGGRDTETDLFGNKGHYKTLLSRTTYKSPCIKCNGTILKESFLGGTIYYCPNCQKLK